MAFRSAQPAPAKEPEKVEKDKAETALPVKQESRSGAPAFMADKMMEDAGKGVSTAQEDNLVPLIYVLDAKSPQVNDRDEAYIEGARGGDIWLRNAIHPIVKGAEGILFQPCYFYKDWVEWVPRDDGGGLVGRHDERPKEAVERPDKQDPTKMVWTMPNGNQVKETRYHAGFVLGHSGGALPYVIPMSGTGHSVSKAWMFMMNQKVDERGNKYPSYASVFRLTTKMRKNKKGTWFVFEAHDAGFVESVEDYERGAATYEAFRTGALRAMQDETVHAEEPAGDDATM